MVGKLAPLRAALQDVGYTEAGLSELLGPWVAEDGDLLTMLLRARHDAPLPTLARLLLLGQPVPARAARAALGEDALAIAAGTGLIRIEGHLAVPSARIEPWRDLLLVSDRLDAAGHPLRQDHVMGVAASTRVLADLTVRAPVRRALDLGTGSGVHALLAARHAGSVVATDVVERCSETARLNAELNEVSLDVRTGDLAEPVQGERFDLVVSNPPFVLSAGRDGWRSGGDSLSGRLLAALPDLLAAGGTATVLLNWPFDPDEGLAAPMLRATEGFSGDRWLVLLEAHDVASYVAGWALGLSPEQRGRDAGSSCRAHRDAGVTHVAGGALVLRAGAHRGWTRVDDVRTATASPTPGFLLQQMAVEDLLASGRDAVLAATVHRAPGAHVSVDLDEALHAATVRLSASGTFGAEATAPAALLALLEAADGGTVAALAEATALRLGQRTQDVVDEVVSTVAALSRLGVLTVGCDGADAA